MARQPSPAPFDGALVIDKPKGKTSHDVVDAVRHLAGFRQIGHLGTLDPLATGVLVLLSFGIGVHKLGRLWRPLLFLSTTYILVAFGRDFRIVLCDHARRTKRDNPLQCRV